MMLGKIGSYIIVFLVLAGKEFLFLPIWVIVARLGKDNRKSAWMSPVITGIVHTVQVSLVILLAGWLIHKIGQSPTWLMFLIPGFLMVRNDIMRINRVESGQSNVQSYLERSGEPESYDQKKDLWVEKGHLVGDLGGWVLGTSLLLQSAGFF